MRIAAGAYFEGFSSDINLFKKWADTAVNSFGQFYARSSSDYPPLYIYVLFLIGKINTFSTMSPYANLIMKMPSILADIASAVLILRIAKKYASSNTGILLSMFYLFNPAVFINSSMWGQVDSFFTFIVAFAVYMLTEKRIGFAAVFFIAAVLMKPQGIIFLPLLFFELVRRKNIKDILKVAVSAMITASIIVLPFSLNMNLSWIYKLFVGTVAEYPYASVNAFNLHSLLGANYVNDASILFIFNYHVWGLMFICTTTMFSWFVYIKSNNRLFASAVAMFQIIGVFTFSTRMHERYLFPAIALAVLSLIYIRDKKLFLISLGVSITSFLNTAFILFHLSSIMSLANYDFFVRIISFINYFSYMGSKNLAGFDIHKKKNSIKAG